MMLPSPRCGSNLAIRKMQSQSRRHYADLMAGYFAESILPFLADSKRGPKQM
jgi:hypothetical protein